MSNCTHEISVTSSETHHINGKVVHCDVTPYVEIKNDQDGYYRQNLENWEDVHEFIEKLNQAAHSAFGEQK